MPRTRSSLRCHALSLLIGLSLAGLKPEGTARAQEAAKLQRVFQLRDGSLVRGLLVEFVPGARVVLALPDGRVQRYDWAELLTGKVLNPEDELIPVKIATDRPVEIYERPQDGKERRALSTATAAYREGPYVLSWLHKRHEFRIGGPGVTSQEFRLPEVGGMQLQITAGRRSRSIAGAVSWVGGGVIAAGGLWVLIAGLITNFSETSAVGPPGWLPLSKQLYISSGTMLVGGLLGFAVGWGCNARSQTVVRVVPLNASSALGLPSGAPGSESGTEL